MIKNSIQKLASDIGYDIGNSDDTVQSDLLNGFCNGLSSSILNSHDLDMQLCYISKNLNQNSEKIILQLSEFIKNK